MGDAANPKFDLLAVNDLCDGSHADARPVIDADGSAGGRVLIRSNRYLHCIGG
jgi:hypothetical protein